MDISWILQIRLSLQLVFGCCLCFAYFLCLYVGLTYSIVLTIVHSDSTSILSLYTVKSSRSVNQSILSSVDQSILSSVVSVLDFGNPAAVLFNRGKQLSF
jgi:hypothetical protein